MGSSRSSPSSPGSTRRTSSSTRRRSSSRSRSSSSSRRGERSSTRSGVGSRCSPGRWRSPGSRRATAAPTTRSRCRRLRRGSCSSRSCSPRCSCSSASGGGCSRFLSRRRLAIALSHPTYALFLLVPLTGFAIVRVIWTRRDVVPLASGLAAVAVPTAPCSSGSGRSSRTPRATRPGRRRFAARSSATRASSTSGRSTATRSRPGLRPERRGRGRRARRDPARRLRVRSQWAAYVVGGSLPILLLTLAGFAFPPSRTSCRSRRQADRRVPAVRVCIRGWCTVLAGFLQGAALPAGLAAGLWLQLTWAGD